MTHMRQEHLDEKKVGEMASRAHVKSVLLDHYSPGSPAAYVAKVKKYFPAPVFAPADLDRYCLDGFPAANTGPAAVLGPCPAGSR
jgi:ribonuclease BN (tRNA processing enzyme)